MAATMDGGGGEVEEVVEEAVAASDCAVGVPEANTSEAERGRAGVELVVGMADGADGGGGGVDDADAPSTGACGGVVLVPAVGLLVNELDGRDVEV